MPVAVLWSHTVSTLKLLTVLVSYICEVAVKTVMGPLEASV